MKLTGAFLASWLVVASASAAETIDFFNRGEAIDLDQVIPANERGMVCLTVDEQGRVFGGTTGRAAHLFVYDPEKDQVRDLARLEGGIGLSYALLRLPDGSFISGTQSDPTGIAAQTDPKAVGHLYRFTITATGPARIEDLGVPVAGQGIYTLAYVEQSGEVAGNTWPDGHFFAYDLKTRSFKGHGAIAGYHTYETPRHAEDINRGTDQKIRYPRQVSRAIAVDPARGAYTAGADGFLYRYDPAIHKLEKQKVQLPAAAGRESWASLDVAVVYPRNSREKGDYSAFMGGTSDGYLMELRLYDKNEYQLRNRGKPFAQGTIQGLVDTAHRGPKSDETKGFQPMSHTIYGVAGNPEGMPRWFAHSHGAGSATIVTGGIPRVNGQLSMEGFGAMVVDKKGNLYAGERDRIARLIRYRLDAEPAPKKKPQRVARVPIAPPPADFAAPAQLDCNIVFAPQGTTTDGSGYTAIEVGLDGQVYVGSARYGDYGWLLRFDPLKKPAFMDKVVGLRELTGERLKGINTQGKIHAKIVVGADGRIWFASKQAHESFENRPEYGEEPEGYPGGHLCYFDPKTGFSRSMGILKRQEGLMGGVVDDGRGKLYYRSEPKNHFLLYDIKSGDVQDRGHVGSACRYSAIDKKGAVYTAGRGQYLSRYDPQTGYVEDLAVEMEGQEVYASPYVIGIGPNGKLYGAGFGHPWLIEYDIDKYQAAPFPKVVARNVAAAAPAGMPVQDIHAGTFGKDGKFYYPLNTTGPLEKGGKPVAHLRIMRFDPATRKCDTVGLPNIVGLDEEKVKHVYNRGDKYKLDHMQGAAVGADGSLYLLDIYPQLNVACFPKLTAPK